MDCSSKPKCAATETYLLIQKTRTATGATVSGIDLVRNGNNGTYIVYPLVDDSPSRML